MMSEVEDEAVLEDITCVEMENESADEGEIVASTEIFGADPLRTLGEILAYCQVMYGAIRKLDEKLELLQARVTNIQADQPSPQREAAEVDEGLTDVPHRRLGSPPIEDTKPPSLLLVPEKASSSRPSSTGGRASPRAVKKMILRQQRNKPDITNAGAVATANPDYTGSRKFVLPSSFLRKAATMSRPTSAARFLLRRVFSHEELVHSNTKGDPARGLKKLDPNKIGAIREWLQKRYVKHDLREDGKDWRACLSVMNKGARYVRLMDKKRKLGVNDRKPASPIRRLESPPAAEIDVELSDSDDGDLRKQKARKPVYRMESDEEESDRDDQVYLGRPDRGVKVPRFAMYTAWQRPSPPLVARYLIKFMFSEDVLIRSNVYGNAEYDMEPLDHNKISALREHLCERFPEMKLEEDGHVWKTCVEAINSSIRKTRHRRKKLCS